MKKFNRLIFLLIAITQIMGIVLPLIYGNIIFKNNFCDLFNDSSLNSYRSSALLAALSIRIDEQLKYITDAACLGLSYKEQNKQKPVPEKENDKRAPCPVKIQLCKIDLNAMMLKASHLGSCVEFKSHFSSRKILNCPTTSYFLLFLLFYILIRTKLVYFFTLPRSGLDDLIIKLTIKTSLAY
jgi:hypothetical protein